MCEHLLVSYSTLILLKYPIILTFTKYNPVPHDKSLHFKDFINSVRLHNIFPCSTLPHTLLDSQKHIPSPLTFRRDPSTSGWKGFKPALIHTVSNRNGLRQPWRRIYRAAGATLLIYIRRRAQWYGFTLFVRAGREKQLRVRRKKRKCV